MRRLLAQKLCDGEPTLERLAARLHMSARTLHRRLENEGTTFRRIVTDVRRELAERHLRERQLGVGEIAFLLGFSEASAFHRAFKRWTGQPPRAHRQAIRWQPVSSPPVGGEGIRAGHASLREERMASRGKAAREGWAPVDENSSLLDDALLAASCRVYGIMLFTNDAYLDRLLPHWRWRHVTLWAAHERCLVRRCDHKRENERRPEPD